MGIQILKRIALPAAVLLGAPAVLALTPAQVDNSTARLWLSGTPALDEAVFKSVLMLCAGAQYVDTFGQGHINPGSFDAHLYLHDATANALPNSLGGFMALTCTVQTDDGGAGSLEGQKLELYYTSSDNTSSGSSFDVFSPHLAIAGEAILNQQLRRVANVGGLGASGQCAAATSEWVRINMGGNFDNTNRVGVYRGCQLSTQQFTTGQAQRHFVTDIPDRPEGGLSSIEYGIIKLNMNLSTNLDWIGSEVALGISQVFGIAVSYPLYYQLQKNDIAAGKIAATCDDAPYTSTAPNLTGACQPNIVASSVTALANADNIGFVDGTLFGAATIPPGPSGKIKWVSRPAGSGTQAAFNLRFLNKPCAMGPAAGGLNPAVWNTQTRNVQVVQASTIGSVRSHLTQASRIGEFALGWMSTTNGWNHNQPNGDSGWSYVKLDGISPDFTDFQPENSAGNTDVYRRTSAVSGNYTAWYNPVVFTAHSAFREGVDLLGAIPRGLLISVGVAGMPGLFEDPAQGINRQRPTSFVGKSSRGFGSSCQPAF